MHYTEMHRYVVLCTLTLQMTTTHTTVAITDTEHSMYSAHYTLVYNSTEKIHTAYTQSATVH